MTKENVTGKWEIEEIYPEGDYQCRILKRKCLSGGPGEDPRDLIVVGEHCKQAGMANIFDKEIAKLIAAAPDLLAACKHGLDEITGQIDDGLLTYSMPSAKRYWLQVASVFETVIRKATE